MASAAEAETAGLFHNAQEGAAIRHTLAKMGHPQPGPTPIQWDNTVATGLANMLECPAVPGILFYLLEPVRYLLLREPGQSWKPPLTGSLFQLIWLANLIST